MNKKILTTSIVILFLGVALAPSIHANTSNTAVDSELVEFTTEVCGLPGLEPQTIQLTQEDAKVVDKLFDEIKLKLDNVESREEAVAIFNEAVVELDRYGFLGGLSVKQAQKLVAGRAQRPRITDLLERMIFPLEDNENMLCMVAGRTSRTHAFGPIWEYREIISLLYNIIVGSIFESEIIFIILLNIFPFYVLSHVSYGGNIKDEPPEPSNGWVWSLGLSGAVRWSGSFYGQIKKIFYSGGWNYDFYAGLSGFEGIVIKLDEGIFYDSFHIGWATRAVIGELPP